MPHLGFNLIRPVLTRPATRAERKLKAAVSCGESKLVEVLLYVHRNRRLIRDGEPRRATSTFTQLLSSEGRSWLVECCFTSTETVGLLGTGNPGRPPRL